MMKALVIISLLGFCLAFIDIPETNDYTDADVNNPLVLDKAHFALTRSAEDYWRRCRGAALVKVTKARDRPFYRWPWSGRQYEIEMIIRTSKGQDKTCETTVWELIHKDDSNMGATILCDCNENTDNE